jgi:hypothetical protein
LRTGGQAWRSFVLVSDAAVRVGHNTYVNDHELRSADLRNTNGLGLPKFPVIAPQLLTISVAGALCCRGG